MVVKKFFKKTIFNSQFFLWFLSYAVIIIVVVLISMFGYGIVKKVTQGEINKSNTQVIHQVKSMFDDHISRIEDNSYQILKSQPVQSILDIPSLPIERQLEYNRGVINRIALYNTNNSIVSDVQVVFRKKDICMDATAKYSKEILYSISYASYYNSIDEWLNDIFIDDLKTLKILENANGEKKLLYIYSYPSVSIPAPLVVITELNQITMNKYLENAALDDKSIISIYDNLTQTLISASSSAADSISYPSVQHHKNATTKINNKKYIINNAISEKLPLMYVHMVENSVYSQKINIINWAMCISYLICLFIGGFLAYLFSKRNYKPVLSLVNKLSNEIQYDHGVSEYSYLENSINNILKDKLNYKNMFDDQKKIYRNTFLCDLLLGKVNTEDIDNSLNYYDIQFHHKYITVVLFNIIDVGLLSNGNRNDTDDLVYFVIHNILSDLMEDYGIYDCKIDNKYACILNYALDLENENRILDELKVLDDVLYHNFNVELASAVSQESEDYKLTHTLYKQVSEIVSYGFLLDGKHILVYDDVLLKSGTYQYNTNMEYRLTNILDLNDNTEAKSIIKNIVDINIGNKTINIYMLRVLFVELTATIIKKAVEADKNQELDIINFCKSATNLTDISKIDDVLNQIYDFVDKLCEIGMANQGLTEISRCENIKKYVEQNYSNPELSVSSIADEFKLSLNYLSTYFKEQTNQGLAGYIVNLRIEKAKELLTATNETIANIAENVGFYSVGVFIRVFKKNEGITPGKYRSIHTGCKEEES